MNRVNYFLHIPKTGGTSLVHYLITHFESERTVGIYLPPFGISAHELVKKPKQFIDAIEFVHGHFPYGLHKFIRDEYRYFTILRNTPDRLLSAYKHHKREGLTEGLGLLRYFFNKRPIDMDNYSIRLLANVSNAVEFGGVTESHLNIAKDNLIKHIEFLGIFEYYNASIANLAKEIGVLPGVPERLNVSPNHPSVSSDSARELRIVVAANELDQMLYDFAKDRFLAANPELTAAD